MEERKINGWMDGRIKAVWIRGSSWLKCGLETLIGLKYS